MAQLQCPHCHFFFVSFTTYFVHRQTGKTRDALGMESDGAAYVGVGFVLMFFFGVPLILSDRVSPFPDGVGPFIGVVLVLLATAIIAWAVRTGQADPANYYREIDYRCHHCGKRWQKQFAATK